MIKQSNNGITLIALVITIIILLILAGVVLSLFLNGGLSKQAQNARVETRGAQVEEARDLWLAEKKIAEYSGTARTLNEVLTDLRQKNLLTDSELDEIDATGQVEIGSRTIVFGKTEKGMMAEYPEIATWIPIYTKEHLQKVGSEETVQIEQEDGKEYVFEYGEDIGYILKNDIDLSTVDFIPLPGLTAGVFLGNDRIISNITIDWRNGGVFHENSGTISYLKVKNVNGNSDNSGIAHTNNGMIINCGNIGTVTGENSGGIAYRNNGTIENCYNTGKITGNNEAGGIASSGGTIINCYNTGEIVGKDSTGGIVGHGEIIINCYNTGKITGNNYIGGIASSAEEIINCYNTGEVRGNNAVGGIAGNGRIIEKCYNTGNITGDNEVGGIAGASGEIANCYNTGTITVKYMIAGGIIGNTSQDVNNCYNIGAVIGEMEDEELGIGAIAGNIYMYPIFDAVNCYYLPDIIANSYGTVKTAEELKGIAGTLGSEWKDDIDNKNNGYPILSWQ